MEFAPETDVTSSNTQPTTQRPPEFMEFAPETDVTSLNFHDTELTLRLPGDPRHFLVVDLNAKSSSAPSCGAACAGRDEPESMSSSAGKSPSAKDEVGWPPLRCFRKKAFQSGRFVKVAVDGAPYLRKVDLEAYCNYRELLRALAEISTCLLYKSKSFTYV
ncbi:Iaa15p [Sarracenia purpurea var. burkii]